MRKTLSLTVLVFLAALGSAAPVTAYGGGHSGEAGAPHGLAPQAYGADLDMDYCYNYLAPFGNWVSFDRWGYVWCPRNMGYRWRPYSDGRWVWTDYGWTWISDLDWGWIPFHYGRWGWDDDLGWFWVPGTVWGPAWVTWRSSDLYMGWAPFPPGIEFRAGIDFAVSGVDIPFRFWVFIGASHFCDREIYNYVLPFERNTTIISHTVIHSSFSWRGTRFVNDGIGVDTVRRVTRQDVPRYALQDARQPGRAVVTGNQVQIYRPSFKPNAAARPKSYLGANEARQELAPARVFEPRQQTPKVATESDVQKRQATERKLMEDSQAQELRALDEQQSQEQKKVQTPSDKTRVQQDYQAKKTEVAKQHQTEKQQLNERHKTDSQQVKQVGQKKAPAKPPKEHK